MKTSKTILGSIFALLSLIIAQLISQSIILILNKIPDFQIIAIIIGAILYGLIAYFSIKFICHNYLHIKLTDIGVTKFHINFIWGIIAFVLPLAVIGSFILFGGHFAGFDSANLENIMFNIFYASLAAGFVEELIFRAAILNILAMRWNYWIAILIPSFIFGCLHIISHNLSFSSIIQLLIAGSLVGIMFSLIELSSHSFWNNALVHSMWNLFTSAIISVNINPKNDAIMTFIPRIKAFWFTGGNFGMESSLIAVVAFIIVIMLALYLIRNKKLSKSIES